MCFCSKKSVSNSKSLRQIDRFYVKFACGECEECRQTKRREYELRLKTELRKVAKLGYTVCFGTLTYNDEHLPHLTVNQSKINDSLFYLGDKSVKLFDKPLQPFTIPCFNRQHVRELFRYLRKYYNKKTPQQPILYLCCMEYGKHTRRPHYHFIIACKDSAENIFNLIRNWWCKNNDFGFIFPRRYQGGDMNRGVKTLPFEVDKSKINSASKYVAKYTTKDISYYQLQEVKYAEMLLTCDPNNKGNIELWNNCKPSLLCSRGLGHSLLDYVKDVDDLLHGVQIEAEKHRVMLPMFLFRRVVYKRRSVKDDPSIKVIEDGVVKYKNRLDLTELGKQYFVKFLETKERDTLTELRLFCEDITSCSMQSFKDFYTNVLGERDCNHFVSHICKNMSELSKVAMYDTYYKDRLSLFHLELLNNDKLAFYQCSKKYSYINVSYLGTSCPYRYTSPYKYVDGVEVVERYDIDGNDKGYLRYGQVLMRTMDNTHKVMPTPSSVDDCGLYFSSYSRPDSIFFTGSETFEEMNMNKLNFIKQYLDYNHYLDEDKIDKDEVKDYFSVVSFNNFPCFRGYDEILYVFYSWRDYCREIKTKIKVRTQEEKSEKHQLLTEAINSKFIHYEF